MPNLFQIGNAIVKCKGREHFPVHAHIIMLDGREAQVLPNGSTEAGPDLTREAGECYDWIIANAGAVEDEFYRKNPHLAAIRDQHKDKEREQ